ncbi:MULTISPECIES: PilZ domain-containing protein [unclassified Neorhizobium]|uniref:PilZ domain-containing protein n=1 Tax=unclassified Neorhizobium TaxID=2629175 RepID=UPI001FF14DC4|nr:MULTISPECIES: PilZ domain-containing protein [unclassified Neorhizobium]MCJ9674269.1 PilZ domain-containing protein [Neorhizobium sp. SHOUNA12B]MCJ9747610.1 PilZ domain-containing protein [Neorhizobium sp. SHOUNA12A]
MINGRMKTRSAERKKTRILGTVKYFNQAVEGRVTNLSATGMALDLGGRVFHAADGSQVRVESQEFGILEGTVKWRRSGRLGVQFSINSNAVAQVSSYFRFFHKDAPASR